MPNTLTTPFDVSQRPVPMALPGAGVEAPTVAPPIAADDELLKLWEEIRKESLDTRKAFEIQWRRNVYYILNRQWIEYIAGKGWRDKRMAQWVPRPVLNKCKDAILSIRAMFTAIKLGVNVRPSGADPKNVSAAATADELAPVLHEVHNMNSVLSEFDFWLLATGNGFLHTFVDYDIKNGQIADPTEQCTQCGAQIKASENPDSTCPDCEGRQFTPAVDDMGEPVVDYKPKGKPTTLVLSPLEIAFPNSYARFEDLPYVVRLRWRTKRYFESNPALKTMVEKISWEKAPSDQNLSLFQSMAQHNDLGISSGYIGEGGMGADEEGIIEYEVWMKPTMDYPEGLVFRIYGERNPQVCHLEEEALPGPLPYKDAEGQPLFTFAHAGFEYVGGRVLASGPIDAIVGVQDLINQLLSFMLLIVNRVANPVWIMSKGSEISKFTGMPGLVLKFKFDPMNPNSKPERIPGQGIDQSLFELLNFHLKTIEDLTGASDALKGIKPGGDMPFSALQLLVERSQARFASVFQARGDAYRQWYKFAIELERAFGPDERTKAVLSPNKRWTFQNFKRTQLEGAMSVVVEDGSTAPKTNLGMRAAMEHAAGLKMLNMEDPDQKYEGLKIIGLTRMVPTLDIHVQAALQKQQAFEEWIANPMKVQQFAMQAKHAQLQYQGQLAAAQADPNQPIPTNAPSILDGTPLKWHPWYDPTIHKQEAIKWANSDGMREIFQTQPVAETLVTAHLAEIDGMLQQAAAQQLQMTMQAKMGGAAAGAGQTMRNSNRESTTGTEPSGSGQGSQRQGPV